jgi:hypothetical protein
MAWTVQNIQNQVQTAVGRSGIDSKVLSWINRVLMELATRAYWTRNTNEVDVSGFALAATTLSNNWVSLTQAASMNGIAIYQAYEGTTAAMQRLEGQDLYSRAQGNVHTAQTGDFHYYALPAWRSYTTTAGEEFLVPQVAALPVPSSSTIPCTMSMLCAPAKLTAAGDTHWFLKKYPQTVLAGVLRYASLYVGDLAGYLAAKGHFENGFRDMILGEETTMVATPALRGVIPEVIQRGGA